MTRYVALLRGIGPTNPNMRPAKLKGAFEKMGFKNVATVISSGNVVFDSPSSDAAVLEAKVEKALPKLLGFKSTTIIRSQDEIEKLVKRNPYKGKVHGREHYTLVTFLKNHSSKLRTLPRKGPGYRVAAVYKREVCTVVDLKSTHTPDLMRLTEVALGKEITSRTWLTVQRILKKMQD